MNLEATNVLIYNNSVVGYRVYHTELKKYYDIALEDAQLINYEYGIKYLKPGVIRSQALSSVTSLELVEQGKLLVPKNERNANVDELTYGRYVTMICHPTMKDSDVELKLLYHEYNKKYFGNALTTNVVVRWSNRMTTAAGYCGRRRDREYRNRIYFDIRLSTHYAKNHGEVENTLVHEMIRVQVFDDGHGKQFKSIMDRINRDFGLGIAVYAHSSATERKYRKLYVCQKCGRLYPRGKKLSNFERGRYTCGLKTCDGKIIDVTDKVENYAYNPDIEEGFSWMWGEA